MVDGINGNNDLAAKALELAKKLDAEDGKEDGVIKKNIWDKFAGEHGGKTVNYGIKVEVAAKSIAFYAKKEGLQGAANRVGEWLNAKNEYIEERTPGADANGSEMKAHNESIDKLNKQAEDIINKYKTKSTSQFGNNDNNLVLSDITSENLPYILKKDPDFFENLTKIYGSNDIEKAIIDLFNKLNTTPMKEATNFKEALKGLKDMARSKGVETKYSDTEINNAVQQDRESDTQTLSGYIKLPEVKARVNETKEKAEELKKQIKDAIKNNDLNTFRSLLKSAERNVLAHVLEDNDIRERLDSNTQRTLLEKLGVSKQEVDRIGNTAGLESRLKEESKKIRDNDNKTIENNEVAQALAKAKPIIDAAMKKLALFANPATNANITKTAQQNGSVKYTYSDNHKFIEELSVQNKPLMVRVGMLEITESNVKLYGTEKGAIWLNGTADAKKLIEYVKNNIIK